jgi:GNAT superfamily N-acetyltransferase
MMAATDRMLDLVEIARLEERRQANMLASVAPLVRPFAGGVMGFHEPGSWQNQASCVGLDGPVDDGEVDAMIDFYVSRGVEPRVELSPFADPSLINALGERGFVVREFEHVLARELPPGEDIEAQLPFGRPAGLELSLVDKSDAEAVERAVVATIQGFYPDGDLPEAMVDACRTTLLLDSTMTFIATIDGVLAAAGSLSCTSPVASLMGVSTAAQFRQRGIQQVLIAARLTAARERGCVLTTIGSRPGMSTERNAIRLGFRVAYTKVIVVRPGEGLATSV